MSFKSLPFFLVLTGCFDFAGDEHRLGFRTDVVVDGVVPWTPKTRVAVGTVMGVEVTEVLSTEKEPTSTSWSLGENVTPNGDDGVWVRGDRKLVVEATADGRTDRFRVRWTVPRRALVGPVLSVGDDTRFGIVKGEEAHVAVGLRDRRGRPLGYRWEDVEFELSSGAIGERDGLPFVQVEEPATLSVDVLGASVDVELIPIDRDSITLTVERTTFDGECVLHATGWSGELPVLDVGDLRWSHSDETGPVARCEDDVTVELR